MTINFKLTAPSRLYWAGRPAMRFVQALHWLHDMLPSGKDSFLRRLKSVLNDPVHGAIIRDDLQMGLQTLPQWMHELASNLLTPATRGHGDLAANTASLGTASGSATRINSRQRPSAHS
jgi:hypothetical protein